MLFFVENYDIWRSYAGTFLRRVCSMHSELTKNDPRRFGYLRTRLYLLQISLTAGKTHRSWYLNSGRPRHMIGERCMFQCLTFIHGETITLRGNKKRLIIEVGKIGIPPYPLVDNVLFVEGLKHNLLSISQLSDNGYDVSFNKDECIVHNNDGSLLFSTKRKDNLYKIRLSELSDQNVSCLLSFKEDHWA